MAEEWISPQDFIRQVDIRPFKREDQVPVKQLILSGLAEHWGWLDPLKNPDLENIGIYFSDGLFLVAECAGEIVGTGGFLPGSDGEAQIVRVHVAEHCRRLGLGSRIVDALIHNASELGYERVVLETTETWEDAIAFYEANGFHITHHLDGDVYMAKQLAPRPHETEESSSE